MIAPTTNILCLMKQQPVTLNFLIKSHYFDGFVNKNGSNKIAFVNQTLSQCDLLDFTHNLCLILVPVAFQCYTVVSSFCSKTEIADCTMGPEHDTAISYGLHLSCY